MLTPIKNSLLILLGSLALVLGVIGAFLPLLPTVPLVLLAGFCFARSSRRLHDWLIGSRYFGAIIRNFEAGKGIPRRVKVRAIALLWISMIASILLVGRLTLALLLLCIGLAVSVYLWRLPESEARID